MSPKKSNPEANPEKQTAGRGSVALARGSLPSPTSPKMEELQARYAARREKEGMPSAPDEKDQRR